MGEVRLAVHATPRAGVNEVVGWREGELQVRVTAPPESGKANAAVCVVIARALKVPKSRVHVVRGETSRHKQLEIEGIDASQVERAFGLPD